MFSIRVPQSNVTCPWQFASDSLLETALSYPHYLKFSPENKRILLKSASKQKRPLIGIPLQSKTIRRILSVSRLNEAKGGKNDCVS